MRSVLESREQYRLAGARAVLIPPELVGRLVEQELAAAGLGRGHPARIAGRRCSRGTHEVMRGEVAIRHNRGAQEADRILARDEIGDDVVAALPSLTALSRNVSPPIVAEAPIGAGAHADDHVVAARPPVPSQGKRVVSPLELASQRKGDRASWGRVGRYAHRIDISLVQQIIDVDTAGQIFVEDH